MSALLLFLASGLGAHARAQVNTGAGDTPRPVYDASNWGEVMGPLKPLWDSWKADQASKGVTWDDEGHITNLDGAVMVSHYRADSVPASAIAWMVQHGPDAGILVGGDPGAVATLTVQEAQRVADAKAAAEAAAEAAAAAAKAAAAGAAGATGGTGGTGGTGPGGTGPVGTNPADPNAPAATPAPGGGVNTSATGGTGSPGTGPETPIPTQDTSPTPGAPPVASTNTLGDRANLKYGTEHPLQVLDLYLPTGAVQPGKKVPVVVFFHGGAFYRGDKKDAMGFLAVVDRGYALASVNYRLLQNDSIGSVDFLQSVGEIAKMLFDARLAVRWLRENADKYGLDANRFAAAGASAGGYLSSGVGATGDTASLQGESAGSTSPAVQAVVDWSGVTNFATFMEQKSGNAGFPSGLATSVISGSGGISPFDFAGGGDPPHLIRHGQQDPVVPYQQSSTYADKLKGAGVQVDIKLYPNLGHEPDPAFLDAEVQATITFLDGVLR